MLNLLILRNSKRTEHTHQTLRTKQAHQIIFQRNVKSRFTRVSLSSGTTAQLIVNTSRFMALCTDNLQSARLFGYLIQLNIGTTTCHIGSNRNGTCLSGFCYNLSLFLMEFGVQYGVLDAFLAEHFAQKLRSLNRNRTNQNRLFFCMSLFDRFHNGFIFFFLRHIYSIIQIDTLHRTVCGNFHNVHTVNITELFFFGKSSTRHSGLFLIFVKEILEGDRGKRLALTFYLHMLFRFNRLMQTIGVAASRHNTSGKLIYNQNLIIFYDIILITEHQIVRTQCQIYIVLDLQIFRIRQVFNVEKFLYFLHTIGCQRYNLIFLIDNEITCLGNLLTHDCRHLCHLTAGLASLQLMCQNVTNFIKLCGFSALSGNNQRSTSLINQYRVHLIDDGVIQLSLYQLLFINDHVVTQIVKTKFVVRNIRNITGILFSSLIVFHRIENDTNLQTEKFMDFSHPLRITLCQIVIDCDNVHTFSFQCIQISRKCGNKCLTFTGTHLCDTSLMQNHATDQLHTIMFHIQHSSCSLTDRRICLRQKIIQCLSLTETFFKFSRLALKFLVTQRNHLRSQCFYFIYSTNDTFYFTLTVCTKQFCYNTHALKLLLSDLRKKVCLRTHYQNTSLYSTTLQEN